jgi:HAD superfamily phosphoserine phosphatase-like hydrolase
MNVFDFDQTIYDGDSTADFIAFLSLRNPQVLLYGPYTLYSYAMYVSKRIEKTEFKQRLYMSVFPFVKDIDRECERFWDRSLKKIKPFYLEMKDESDLIISASPEFLLAEALGRIGVRGVLASRVDKKTGAYDGENCWGEEKARRFREAMGEGAQIGLFYSDSYSDEPLARLAKESFLVQKNAILRWDAAKGM